MNRYIIDKKLLKSEWHANPSISHAINKYWQLILTYILITLTIHTVLWIIILHKNYIIGFLTILLLVINGERCVYWRVEVLCIGGCVKLMSVMAKKKKTGGSSTVTGIPTHTRSIMSTVAVGFSFEYGDASGSTSSVLPASSMTLPYAKLGLLMWLSFK